MATRGRPAVSSLHFAVHVYEDCSYVRVSRIVDLPNVPQTGRLGGQRIDVGRATLAGYAPREVVLLIAESIVRGQSAPA